MLVHSTYHDIIYFTICGVNTLCMNSMETLQISMISEINLVLHSISMEVAEADEGGGYRKYAWRGYVSMHGADWKHDVPHS